MCIQDNELRRINKSMQKMMFWMSDKLIAFGQELEDLASDMEHLTIEDLLEYIDDLEDRYAINGILLDDKIMIRKVNFYEKQILEEENNRRGIGKE